MLFAARQVMFVDILCNAQASTFAHGKAGNTREKREISSSTQLSSMSS